MKFREGIAMQVISLGLFLFREFLRPGFMTS